MKPITLLLFVLVQKATGISTDPLVHWSMDKYEGIVLQPDFGDEGTFTIYLPNTNDKYFQTGILDKALFVKKKLKLMQGIWKTDCIRNPSQCTEGLTVAFWLNVEKFTRKNKQVIMRSSSVDKDLPGIYIGGDEDDQASLLFLVRTASGEQYQCTVPQSFVLNLWTHIAMTWSSENGIEVFINGSALAESQYTIPPKADDVSTSYPMRVDFILGDILGPVFLLDDFWIFYKNLSEIEILSLYEIYVPETTTRTSTTEQTPPPRSTTLKSTRPDNAVTNPHQVNGTITQERPVTPVATSSDTDISKPTTTKAMVIKKTEASIAQPTTIYVTNLNQTNGTTPTFAPTKPKIITTTMKPPVTSSDWQFYNNVSFFIILGCIILVLLLCAMFCILKNRYGSSSKENENEQICEEQSMPLKPLV